MPIYEYRCADCGHELEVMQKLADAPLQDCPECEQPGLKKKISPVGFRLKGSGWYETDFKTGNKKNLVEGEKGDKKTDQTGDKAAETKDAQKTDAKSGNGKSSSGDGGSSGSSDGGSSGDKDSAAKKSPPTAKA